MFDGIKLIGVFILMIVFLIRKVPLVYVLFGGASVLALLFRTSPKAFLLMLVHGIIDPVTIELLCILWFIMILEYLMRSEGYMERMLTGLQRVVPYPRFNLCLLPAFIGLMPSAGGAIFSAPLVSQASQNMAISPELKSFVNFYYRHISEFLLPIYPNVLLAASLTGVSISTILQHMLPFGLSIILLGIPVVLKIPKPEKLPKERNPKEAAKQLFIGLLPILVVVFFVLFFGVRVWVIVGLILLTLFVWHRYQPADVIRTVQKSFKPSTLMMVVMVMIFKRVLEETGAVAALPALMNHLPISPHLVFVGLFFLLGLLTGFVGAVVGIGFPVALASFGALDAPTIVLFLLSGLAGQMLTPLHLCLSLTVDYFRADLGKVIQYLLAPELTLLLMVNISYQLFHGGLW